MRGPKVLEEVTVLSQSLDAKQLDHILEWYYGIASDEHIGSCASAKIHGRGVVVCRLTSELVLIAVPESGEVRAQDLNMVRQMVEQLSQQEDMGGLRSQFRRKAYSALVTLTKLAIIVPENIASEKAIGRVVAELIERKRPSSGALVQEFEIGRYRVRLLLFTPDQADMATGPDWNRDSSVFSVVPLAMAPDSVVSLVHQLRHRSSMPTVVVVPENAPELVEMLEGEDVALIPEEDYQLPSDIVISIMRASGLINMPETEVRRRWKIDECLDQSITPSRQEKTTRGHQAFLVVDKMTGEATFAYHYQESPMLKRMSNIVAAISSFKIQVDDLGKTSVFTVGDLNYLVIEKKDLLFTLVTSQDEDLEALRERFSFLPELYFDEQPAVDVKDTHDPYSARPFLIKLLATIPPERARPRYVPYKLQAPDWTRFSDESVAEFLKALWNIIDGRVTLGRFMTEEGPRMALGGIYFLKSMNCVDFRLVLTPNDRPRVTKRPDDHVLSAYKDLGDVLELADGMLTVDEISSLTGVDLSVLLRVFGDLYRREIIDLE
ncbi:MAG: hypothetical protein QXS20_10710 [Candidatus Thorarchaeota archaeon]